MTSGMGWLLQLECETWGPLVRKAGWGFEIMG